MSKRPGEVIAVVGAQYGSEGKGVIVNHIANKYNIHVRTGGPNAGHTYMHQGQKIVMQTIPCGWTNPDATLVIGAGALIDLDNLEQELKNVLVFDTSIFDRLKIDAKAHVISHAHREEEGGIHGEMHQRIGSTGKGVGTARRDRVMRDPRKIKTFGEAFLDIQTTSPIHAGMIMEDTAEFLNSAVENGDSLLLEGTQGTGLDLIHGPWPYVTSNGCTAAQMLADCGLAPRWLTDVLLVARTFPIRVAGNSGPMYQEVDWDYISGRMGRPTSEQTTVTKKTRRIGRWDDELFGRSVVLNGANQVAITFADYYNPKNEGVKSYGDLTDDFKEFMTDITLGWNIDVVMVGTGGEGWQVVDVPSI